MKVKIRGLVFAGFAAAVFAQSALAITDDDKTVTSKTYVDSKVEATVSGETTINSESPDDKAPSSLNVYKFVTDQMDDLAEVAAIQGDGTYLNVTTETVGTGDNAHDVKQVNVITGNLASTAALISAGGASGAQALDQGKLTTAKAVYDFVTGNDDPNGGFHPKLTSAQASGLASWSVGSNNNGVAIAVGYRAYDSQNPNAVQPSEWKTFGARPDGDGTDDDGHLSYLEIQQASPQDRDKYVVDIKDDALAKNATAISAVANASGTYAAQTTDKLATAYAVYEYAVKQNWGTNNAGKKLVINNSGYVDLTDAASGELPPESTMPEVCKTANGGHVCALVAYYDASVGTNGGVKYQWTVMAPTGSTGGGSGSGSGSGTPAGA